MHLLLNLNDYLNAALPVLGAAMILTIISLVYGYIKNKLNDRDNDSDDSDDDGSEITEVEREKK